MRTIVCLMLLLAGVTPAASQPTLDLSVDAFEWHGAVFPEPGQPFSLLVSLQGTTDEVDGFAFRLLIPRYLSVISFSSPAGAHVTTTPPELIGYDLHSYDIGAYVPFQGCVGGTDPTVLLEVRMSMPVQVSFLSMSLTGLEYHEGVPMIDLCQGELLAVGCAQCVVEVWPDVTTDVSSWGMVKSKF